MQEQLSLSLVYRPAFGRGDFLVAPCNQEAVTWIDRYPDWPTSVLIICGEAGSGKSHLASIFTQTRIAAAELTMQTVLDLEAQKIVVEDVDQLKDEEALFHLYNKVLARHGALLLTARQMPTFHLKDLQSRLNAAAKAYISMPDEALMCAVLMKAFDDRHLTIDAKVIEYAATRLPRSFDAIKKVIEAADLLSLRKQHKITVPLMREALDVALAETSQFY